MILGKFREGEQHVLCFNPITLMQLLDRHGYELTSASSCYQTRREELRRDVQVPSRYFKKDTSFGRFHVFAN